jgi:hypothetical protein
MGTKNIVDDIHMIQGAQHIAKTCQAGRNSSSSGNALSMEYILSSARFLVGQHGKIRNHCHSYSPVG